MNAAEKRKRCDPRALRIAKNMLECSGAEAAILFGSRARGDHRPDSDVDILLISDHKPPDRTMHRIEAIADLVQQLNIPGAGGVDIGYMTPEEFWRDRPLLNSLAREVAKHGVAAMPGDDTEHRNRRWDDYADEEPEGINWPAVQDRYAEATETVNDLQAQTDENGQVKIGDRNFGFLAQRALECSYKAVLGSHGIEYPTTGRDGHNLSKLTELMRDQFGSPVPGESHSYLTEFGGASWYAREHRPLDKPTLAREVPAVVWEILALKRDEPQNRG